MKLLHAGWMVAVVVSLVAAGCGKAEVYGTPPGAGDSTAIREILSGAGELGDRQVTVEGTIVRECPSGCWFELKDESGSVRVDLAPSGLAIPQRVGKTVAVLGTVSTNGPQVEVVGSGVEIK